jgi:aryl sulfotransferase
VRYEDMLADGKATFTAVLQFSGFEVNETRLVKALRFSSFSQLQTQEQTQGFRERSPRAQAFFRQGKTGGWRQALSQDQVAVLIDTHRDVMRRFGYLAPDDTPLC